MDYFFKKIHCTKYTISIKKTWQTKQLCILNKKIKEITCKIIYNVKKLN